MTSAERGHRRETLTMEDLEVYKGLGTASRFAAPIRQRTSQLV